MQTFEPFLPFSDNLLYKPLRFDDKLDLIKTIIPLDPKTCLLIDRTNSFHLKTYSKKDDVSASLQFPLPPYAHNSNPKVIYSVHYLDLSRYLNKKIISGVLDPEREKDIKIVHLGDYKLAVQFDDIIPVTILDLQRPKDPPVIVEETYSIESLISVGNCCLAWYERSTKLVILYHSISRKRKVLNFTKLKIRELHSLKDHVIIAASGDYLEILDYSKNKVIKGVGFLECCEYGIPVVAVHSEGNLISYIENRLIYVCKTERGKIEWQNHFPILHRSVGSDHIFITENLIALKTKSEIKIFYLDSQSLSQQKIIKYPWLGFSDKSGLELHCCMKFPDNNNGSVKSIHSLGGNSFGIVEKLCSMNQYHGQQRVSVFTLENIQGENVPGQPPTRTFNLQKSVIFEEFRDLVQVIDVFDENTAMFITERGRVFRINLKSHSIEYILELNGLVVQEQSGKRKINKFFVLAGNRVAISTKTDLKQTLRIFIFSLENRYVEWDSMAYGGDEEDEEDEFQNFSFYDMVKLSPKKILLCYNMKVDNVTSYNIGKLSPSKDERDNGAFVFSEYNMQKPNEMIFDRLWNLEGSLVAMRHGERVFHLSFVNPKTRRIEKEFDVGKYLSIESLPPSGILDVQYIDRRMICIQLKWDRFTSAVFIYNIQTEELIHRFKTDRVVIGTIRKYFQAENLLRTMDKTMVFGPDQSYGNCLIFKSVQNLIAKKTYGVYIERSNDHFDFNIHPRNFKPLPIGDQRLMYENHNHMNFVCILKSPNFKLECLRILQREVGNTYHEYIYKNVVDMIFGTQ